MDLQTFMTFVRETNKRCEETLRTANREYATEEDKFSNFHVTASILREINPRLKEIKSEDIAFIFMMKHLFSIAKGISLRESLQGRFDDCHNYLHLIHGIHVDKKPEEIQAIHERIETTIARGIEDFNRPHIKI